MTAQTGIQGEHNPAARFLMLKLDKVAQKTLAEQITAFYTKTPLTESHSSRSLH